MKVVNAKEARLKKLPQEFILLGTISLTFWLFIHLLFVEIEGTMSREIFYLGLYIFFYSLYTTISMAIYYRYNRKKWLVAKWIDVEQLDAMMPSYFSYCLKHFFMLLVANFIFVLMVLTFWDGLYPNMYNATPYSIFAMFSTIFCYMIEYLLIYSYYDMIFFLKDR